MFDHVTIRVSDRDASQRFYTTVLGRPPRGERYRDDGEPGPRPQYSDDYYGAFVLDPDGNNVELVDHGR